MVCLYAVVELGHKAWIGPHDQRGQSGFQQGLDRERGSAEGSGLTDPLDAVGGSDPYQTAAPGADRYLGIADRRIHIVVEQLHANLFNYHGVLQPCRAGGQAEN